MGICYLRDIFFLFRLRHARQDALLFLLFFLQIFQQHRVLLPEQAGAVGVVEFVRVAFALSGGSREGFYDHIVFAVFFQEPFAGDVVSGVVEQVAYLEPFGLGLEDEFHARLQKFRGVFQDPANELAAHAGYDNSVGLIRRQPG